MHAETLIRFIHVTFVIILYLDDWLTVHSSVTLVDLQLDAQNSCLFTYKQFINPLNAELNPICHLLALLGVHHFLHVSRIRVKSLTLRLLMSYLYAALILDVSRSHTTHHSR